MVQARSAWRCSWFAMVAIGGCASQPDDAVAIATDGVSLYWSTASGTIEKAPASGGPSVTLATHTGGLDLVVDATNVYSTACQHDPVRCAYMALFAMPTTGGPPTTISTAVIGGRSFTSNGTDLFWLEDGGIAREPIAGGVASFIGPATGGSTPGTVVADATNVYYMRASGIVSEISLNDGATADFAVNFVSQDLALDQHNLYVLRVDPTSGTGDVLQIPRDGSPTTTLTSSRPWLGRIAVDAHYVYWTSAHPCAGSSGSEPGKGHVERVPIDGGTVETIGTNAYPWGRLAVAEETVSWVSYFPNCGTGSGPIVTVSK